MINALRFVFSAAITAALLSLEVGAAELPQSGRALADAPVRAPGDWYLRGQLGVAGHHRPDIVAWQGDFAPLTEHWSEVELTRSAAMGGGIGIYLSPHWRTDVTFDYRWGAEASGEAFLNGRFDVTNTVVLANIYLDLDDDSVFTPYVGLGFGWSHNVTHDGTIRLGVPRTLLGAESDELAAALMGGIAYQVTAGLAVDAGYRLLYMGDVTAGDWISGVGRLIPAEPRFSAMVGHEFRVGLRYDLPW